MNALEKPQRRGSEAPCAIPDTLGSLSPQEEALAAFIAKGLRTAEAARASGMRHSEAMRSLAKPEFKSIVNAILQGAADYAIAGASATIQGRINSAAARHEATSQIIEQRAAAADPRFLNPDPEFIRALGYDPDELISYFPNLGELYDQTNPVCHMCDPGAFLVPGASTGLLARSLKIIGSGKHTQQVEEWKIDPAVLNELRNAEKALATATGQGGKGAGKMKMYVNVDMGRLFGGAPGSEVPVSNLPGRTIEER